mmetsp:Transcript_29218/g.40363  ORF Transcript_29218/g.40363 Transcript_29218/m.40363 type:complete len:206 (+) Transcript_29218:188-805(+)
MPSKPAKKAESVAVAEELVEEEIPSSGTDFFRYLPPVSLVYEGSFDTYTPPPPEPASVEAPPADTGGKKSKTDRKDSKASKEAKRSQTAALDELAAVNEVPAHLVKHGEGTYNDGEVYYSGQFDTDVVHGQGLFKYPSGASYEGQWNQGKYEGIGKYTWSDGCWYEGGWLNNNMHGMGKYFNKNTNTFYGGQYYNGAGPGFYGDI